MPNNQDITVGERIRAERERLHLSQSALADKTGVSRGTQFNYEVGKGFPTAEYLLAAGKVGVDVGFVLFGERTTPNSVYSMGVARVLPHVIRQLGFEYSALSGIIDLAAEDEALGWARGEIPGNIETKIMRLIEAFFEHSDLLGKIFTDVARTLHERQAKLPPDKKAEVVLMLYEASKARGRVDKKTLEIAVKAAIR